MTLKRSIRAYSRASPSVQDFNPTTFSISEIAEERQTFRRGAGEEDGLGALFMTHEYAFFKGAGQALSIDSSLLTVACAPFAATPAWRP